MHRLATKLKIKLSSIIPILNERQRRLLAGLEASSIGHGGIKILSDITGMDRKTIRRGIKDSKIKHKDLDRVRTHGGGRKRITSQNSEIIQVIENLIEPDSRGDPETPLRWTIKSVRNIADFLVQKGYHISHQSVASILHDLDYSLQSNKKTKEGKNHPDRDAQFKYISKVVKDFLRNKYPVISVDTKKKELVGNYKNSGKEWQAKGKPKEVNSHDFPNSVVPKAVPYGIYDIGNNKGWINIGISSDTAEFAVDSIRYWWNKIGKKKYANVRKILICADAGGSNSYRSRLWKKELQEFSDKEAIKISVCHFPPGTSKWNKIEHRLFSFISINWRGKPLTTYQTIINLITSTKTNTGLQVQARLNKKTYKKGIKVTEIEMQELNIHKDKFHGEWNYTIKPRN